MWYGPGAAHKCSLRDSFMDYYQQLKNIYHWCQASFWRVWYGSPDTHLHIFGVTGTNGKTTTSYLLTSILGEAFGQDKVGMLTTVAFRVGTEETMNETKMTTLPSRLVYKYLRKMQVAKVTHVVLEMTSHALDQHRLAGIKLDGAIILNVEREHLDYHKTMEAYAGAKARIIHYLKLDAPLVGKADDERVKAMLELAKNVGYPIVEFTAKQALGQVTKLEGAFNKENALAASLLARAVAIPEAAITAGIDKVTFVPGRMQWITAPAGFKVLIDYAVTPDALERLYAYTKQATTGKVFGVLGAAGLRDRGKRADMARIVKKYTDFLVITREDPWTEPEEQIFADLEAGLDKNDATWKRIVDRKEALQFVLSQAQAGDIVVVTGKGAETGMAIGNTVVPWSEVGVIKELLQRNA